MTTITRTFLVDGLDGSTEDVENVQISLDGTNFEIDLRRTPPGCGKAGEVCGPRHPCHATADRRSQRIVQPPPSGRDQVQAVRECARQNGYTVSARGRIPKNVQDAFAAAH